MFEPFVLDCMDAGGRATQGAVAESLSKYTPPFDRLNTLWGTRANGNLNFTRPNLFYSSGE
jgi:hypothetical protein